MRHEINIAVAQLIEANEKAREIDEALASQAGYLLRLLLPNIRRCGGASLAELKTALRDFDLRSQMWKRKP